MELQSLHEKPESPKLNFGQKSMCSAVTSWKSFCKMFCIAQNFIELDLEEIVPYLETNI